MSGNEKLNVLDLLHPVKTEPPFKELREQVEAMAITSDERYFLLGRIDNLKTLLSEILKRYEGSVSESNQEQRILIKEINSLQERQVGVMEEQMDVLSRLNQYLSVMAENAGLERTVLNKLDKLLG